MAHKMGIIGYGGMAGWHHGVSKEIDGLEVVAVYDIKPERVQAAIDNGVKGYYTFEEFMADKSFDIVLVATPNDFHKEYVIAALNDGRNAISEKPVTLSSADLQEMIDAANRSGKIFTVHQNRRWDEDFLTMKKIYDEGSLGDIYRIESRVHGSRGIPGDWRGEKVHGGGMMLDWGVHIIDQMLQMIHAKIKSVYCQCTHVTNYEVDDGFSLTLKFDNGVTAMLEVGTSNFIELPRWYMLGENGSATITDWSMQGKIVRVTTWDQKDVVPIKAANGLTKTMAPRTDDTINTEDLPNIGEVAGWEHFYQNLLDAIDGKAESIIRHDEVMRVMKVMEAAFESDRLDQVIHVDL